MQRIARLGAVASLVLTLVAVGHADEQKPTVIYQAPKKGGAPAPLTLPTPFVKAMQAAQAALDKQQWADAIAELKTAQATSGKTPQDDYQIDEMLGYAYVKSAQYREAAQALEAGLNSGLLKEDETPNRLRALTHLNYEIKNYDKAVEFGNRAIQSMPANEELRTLVAQAFYLKGDYKNAFSAMNAIVDAQIGQKQQPKKESLQLILSACVKLDDKPCLTQALERMVAYYPSREYWQNLVYTLMQPGTQTEKNLVQNYRLAFELGLMQSPGEYAQMASMLMEQGLPGEAQQMLEKGFTEGVFTRPADKTRNRKLLESAKLQAANDKAVLARSEGEAAAARNGNRDIGLGSAYYTYGQYAKAIETLERGLTKGGLRNEADARLLLGIVQFKAGKMEEARKTFAQVKGDPTLEQLGKLWLIYINSPR